MNTSGQTGMVMPTRNKMEIVHALEREAETARLSRSWHNVAIWMIPNLYLLFDILGLHCAICAHFISFILPCEKVHPTAYVVEITAFAICLSNLLVCLIEAAKISYYILTGKNYATLTSQQASLLGITDPGHYSVAQSESSPKVQQVSFSTADPSSQNFITRWLSALHFGDWQSTRQISQNYMLHNISDQSFGTSFSSGRTGSAFTDSALFKHSTPLGKQHSPYKDRHSSHSVSLSARVGSSPNSRPNSSIQTSKQLEEYLRNSSLSNGSFHDGLTSFSTSFGSASSPNSSRVIRFSPPFRFYSPENTSYEVGTAMLADEQGKAARDENSVVSLVTGSRVMVTEKRVSLSPIPLNLIAADNELVGGNGKGIASDGTDVARNADNDSITFRVIHNAAKESPKKGRGSTPPLLRRSDSNCRRQTSSSPRTQPISQFSNVVQLNGVTSSPTGIQIPITSSEILNQYKMDAEDFAVAERHLRSWICQTILRPLVAKIDEVNGILAKSHAQLHLKVGHSSVEALQVAASSKNELLKTPLPYILPYLKAHEKQAYLVKRCRDLAADLCIKNYHWQGGGNELLERKESEYGYSPPERPWGEHLPTDAQLIWSWFAAYMDARMGANPLVNDIEAPFSSVFYLKKPSRPSQLQCLKKSFYIYQSCIHPPHFELVLDGGRERFEVDRGAKNLWRTILLFIQHVRLFNNNQLGNIKIDHMGINLACVLE